MRILGIYTTGEIPTFDEVQPDYMMSSNEKHIDVAKRYFFHAKRENFNRVYDAMMLIERGGSCVCYSRAQLLADGEHQ